MNHVHEFIIICYVQLENIKAQTLQNTRTDQISIAHQNIVTEQLALLLHHQQPRLQEPH